jgi:hypothetical protein
VFGGSASSVRSAPFRFAGNALSVEVTRDSSAVSRRMPGRRIDRELLEALFLLPPAVAIPERQLPAWARRLLADGPDWAVDRRHGSVARTYEPPCSIDAIMPGQPEMPWAEQLEQLRWFTPLGPAAVVVPSVEDALQVAPIAVRTGLGVRVSAPDDGLWDVVPMSVSGVQLTVQRWWLAEMAFAHLKGPDAAPATKLGQLDLA